MKLPMVLTFVSQDYIQVGWNWLTAIRALGCDAKVRIIALDAATRDAFPPDIVIYRPSEAPGLAALWVHRIKVLRDLLEKEDGIIHSDADAVWVRNPLPMIATCNVEMAFSQGTIWPHDVHARHDIVLCCGFFYLSNTPAVRTFLQEIEERVARDEDDQISVNRQIDEAGVTWMVEAPYRISFRKTAFTASRGIIRSQGAYRPSVAVLPHHMFPRVIDQLDGDVMVAHPFSAKASADKKTVLTRLGLWHCAL